MIAGLGFSSAQSTTGPSGLVRDAGITSIAADSINQAAQDSASTRWVALILGAFFLYTTSVALMKALFVAHALIWQVPVPRIAHKPRAVGELLLAIVLLILSSCVASVVREHSPGYGLVLMLADTLVYAVIWWGFSSRLPHSAASLLQLLPGALLQPGRPSAPPGCRVLPGRQINPRFRPLWITGYCGRDPLRTLPGWPSDRRLGGPERGAVHASTPHGRPVRRPSVGPFSPQPVGGRRDPTPQTVDRR